MEKKKKLSGNVSKKKAEEVIPGGPYCYGYNGKLCPFWRRVNNKPEQLDGYCTYLEIGDWMEDSYSDLWDQIKSCDINIGIED